MQSTPEIKTHALTLLKAGLSYPQVSEEIGFSVRTIRSWHPGYGNRKLARRLTKAEVDRAMELLEDGASYEDTAETIGCSPTALRYRFPGYGWTKKQNGSHRHRAARLSKIKPRTQGPMIGQDSALRLSGTLERRT